MKLYLATAVFFASLVFSACGNGGEDGPDGPSGPICGNNIVETGEACDDGNSNDDDGCLSTCELATCGDGVVQAGVEECDDGNDVDTDSCTTACRNAVCGDGFTQPGEECDDGNDVETDACLSTCVAATCGDGFVREGVEGCDDGNDDDTDECLSTCVLASCGDGVVQADELCDDGNDDDTDGCLSSCIPARCGDSVVQAGVEECDDGNADDTDACTTLCRVAECGDGFVREGLEACDDGDQNSDTVPNACRTDCTEATCGDGVQDASEACDLGDENSDTGACTTSCRVARCGDGFIQGTEACDDGGLNGNTGACLADCRLASCGDGFVHIGVEACDEGANNSETGACLPGCAAARCGDGFVRAGFEECDEGPANSNTGTCTLACAAPRCGDGFIQGSEICDEGAANSNAPNAYCRPTCQLSHCGDGVVDSGEGCDDGNAIDNDACSNLCTLNGDTCAAPAMLQADITGGFTVSGDTRLAAADYQMGCDVSGFNRDLVYQFTAPFTGRYTFSVIGSFNTGIAVQTVCGDPASNLACNQTQGNNTADTVVLPLQANDTVFLLVDGYGNSTLNEGTFTLTGTGIPFVPVGGACDVTGVTSLCVEGSQCDTTTQLCRASVCGDGVVESGEACDDGNNIDNDACSNACLRNGDDCAAPLIITSTAAAPSFSVSGNTTGFGADYTAGCGTATGPADMVYQFTAPVHGTWTITMTSSFDMVMSARSSCGDIATELDCSDAIGSGATETVTLVLQANETVFFFADGWGTSTSNQGAFTLSGTVVPFMDLGASCDPAGVANKCVVGTQCTGTPPVCTASVCGNGVRESGEQCDDGGTVAGDGCDANCEMEAIPLADTGLSLVFQGSLTTSDATWAPPLSSCASTARTGVWYYDAYYVKNTGTTPKNISFGTTTWSTDAYLFMYGLPWDPLQQVANCQLGAWSPTPVRNNVVIPPGETRVIVVGSGYAAMVGNYTLTVTTNPICGDGIWSPGEQCEDGNTGAGDGCSATCTFEAGYSCTQALGCYFNQCGDGIVGNGEPCDDGNTIDTDVCSNACTLNGDTCAAPAVIATTAAAPGFTVSADTRTATANYQMGCDVSGFNRDLVYEFTAPVGGRYTFSVIGNFNTGIAVQQTCGVEATNLACNQTQGTNTADTVNVILQANDTVFILVDGYGNSTLNEGMFTLTGTVAPFVAVGDACDPTGVANLCATGLSCSSITQTCVAAVCGNGILELNGGEQCDDGGLVLGDGCDDLCQLEAIPLADLGLTLSLRGSLEATDPSWAPPTSSCTSATRTGTWHYDAYVVRNDGLTDKTIDIRSTAFPTSAFVHVFDVPWNPAQQTVNCLRGSNVAAPSITNLVVPAGATRMIIVSSGNGTNPAQGPYTLSVTTRPVCGDNIWSPGEQCEDGNTSGSDGCSATCTFEAGYSCTQANGCFFNQCGDGVVGNGEPCDDGNTIENDVCTSACTLNGDTCAAPAIITTTAAAPGFSFSADTRTATANYQMGCDVSGFNRDLVYQFTAPIGGRYTFSVIGTFNTGIAVQQTCGVEATNLACIQTQGNNTADTVHVELQANDTVFILVDGYGNSTLNEGPFTLTGTVVPYVAVGASCDPAGLANLCVVGSQCEGATPVCRASVCGDGIVESGERCDDGDNDDTNACKNNCQFNGDTCASPVMITSTAAAPAFTIAGDTRGVGADYQLGCSTSGFNGDLVYQFTAPIDGRWRFTLTGTGFDPGLAIRTTCDDPTTNLACAETTSNPEVITRDMQQGEMVFLLVDGYSNTARNEGPFTLAATVVPFVGIGDACDAAGTIGLCGAGARCDATTNVCVATVCGNGIVEPEGGEQCDDANTNDVDSCSNGCMFNGDTCAAPAQIVTTAASPGFTVAGDTRVHGADYQLGCEVSGFNGDTVYQFTAPIHGRWRFAVTGVGFDTGIAVQSTCGETSSNLACIETGSAGATDAVNVDIQANDTVFILVDGYGNSTSNEGAYTLVGTVIPIVQVGDACDTAGTTAICDFGSKCDPTSLTCIATVCGNGIVEAEGGEVCDDGDTDDWNACANNCQIRGDTCAAPFDLRLADTDASPGTLAVAGTLVGMNHDYVSSCYNGQTSTSNYRDAVYALHGNGVTDEHWTLTLASASSTSLILDVASACGPRNARIACVPSATSTAPKTVSFHLGANETVYVWVDTVSSTTAVGYSLSATVRSAVPVGGLCDPAGVLDRCVESASCDATGVCVAATCGNTIVEGLEECDDGNNIDYDGCSSNCYREGDTCNAPFDLNAINTSMAPDTWLHEGTSWTGMTANYVPSCSIAGGYSDVVYSFTAPAAGSYRFRETSTRDVVIYAAATCPNPGPAPDLFCADSPEEFTRTMAANETIFVFIDPYGSTQGAPTGSPYWGLEVTLQ